MPGLESLQPEPQPVPPETEPPLEQTFLELEFRRLALG